jgi:hypothetical protein
MLDYLPAVTIHSAIADPGNWESKNSKGQVAGHGCVQLWYFFRAIDFQGCGDVEIDLRIAALALDKSLYTIRRWLKFGLEMGFFRGCRRVGTKQYRIFYTSLKNICNRLNLADIGACTDIEVKDLKNAKFIATEATTKQLQEQSRFQASEGKRKNLKKCIPSPEVLTTSDLCTGAILYKVGRFTYLKFYAHPHGASQKRISQNLSRHPSTIQRRLSDGYRQRHLIKPIPKTQLLASPKRTVIGCVPCPGDKTRTMAIHGIDKGFKQKIWKTSLGYFRLCPNVYDISVELTSRRRLRSKIKRSVKNYESKRWIREEDEFKRWMASEEGRTIRQQGQEFISSLYET